MSGLSTTKCEDQNKIQNGSSVFKSEDQSKVENGSSVPGIYLRKVNYCIIFEYTREKLMSRIYDMLNEKTSSSSSSSQQTNGELEFWEPQGRAWCEKFSSGSTNWCQTMVRVRPIMLSR